MKVFSNGFTKWSERCPMAGSPLTGPSRATWAPGEVPALPASTAATPAEDLRLHVEVLAGETMEGRLTGTKGEMLATAYVADAFERLDGAR